MISAYSRPLPDPSPFSIKFLRASCAVLCLAASPFAFSATIPLWINEIHYDNQSTDEGEFIEIAGHAGVDLTSYSLILYNGNGGTLYDTLNLFGFVPDQQHGLGTVPFSYPVNGIQNGAPDGIALVAGTNVVQFLSYEGSFTAIGGPADGLTSVDIGVSEDGNTPAGSSLQLAGTGRRYADFIWFGPLADTLGAPNANQLFEAPGVPETGATLALLAFPLALLVWFRRQTAAR